MTITIGMLYTLVYILYDINFYNNIDESDLI